MTFGVLYLNLYIYDSSFLFVYFHHQARITNFNISFPKGCECEHSIVSMKSVKVLWDGLQTWFFVALLNYRLKWGFHTTQKRAIQTSFLFFIFIISLFLLLSSFLLCSKYISGGMAPQWSSRTILHSSNDPKTHLMQGHFILQNARSNIFDAHALDRPVILKVLNKQHYLCLCQFWKHRNKSFLCSWERWWTQGGKWPLCTQDMINL